MLNNIWLLKFIISSNNWLLKTHNLTWWLVQLLMRDIWLWSISIKTQTKTVLSSRNVNLSSAWEQLTDGCNAPHRPLYTALYTALYRTKISWQQQSQKTQTQLLKCGLGPQAKNVLCSVFDKLAILSNLQASKSKCRNCIFSSLYWTSVMYNV